MKENFGLKGGIIVLAEIFEGKIISLTLEILGCAISLAAEMKLPVSVIITGKVSDSELEKIRYYGCDEIICLSHPKLTDGHLEAQLEALLGCMVQKEPVVILTGASSFGRILAPQIAYSLQTEIVTDASHIFYDTNSASVLIKRPAPDGKMINEYIIQTKPVMASFRQGICRRAIRNDAISGSVLKIDANWLDRMEEQFQYDIITGEYEENTQIENAQVIVSGGRGIKGDEGFRQLKKLSAALGGQTGCTRPCVDAGWMHVSQQIGQSGKTVHPKLYLACGISGAIQHMAGVQAETLIAVNNNPEASIFRYCDYGFVGDAGKIISALLEKQGIK